jgi:hypothetical protein
VLHGGLGGSRLGEALVLTAEELDHGVHLLRAEAGIRHGDAAETLEELRRDGISLGEHLLGF